LKKIYNNCYKEKVYGAFQKEYSLPLSQNVQQTDAAKRRIPQEICKALQELSI